MGGAGSGSSNSKPLTPEQVAGYYRKATETIGSEPGGQLAPFVSAGPAAQARAANANFYGTEATPDAQTAFASAPNTPGVTSAGASNAAVGTFDPAAQAKLGTYGPAVQSDFTSAGAYRTLTGGDYEALTNAIYDPQAREINRNRGLALNAVNEDLARRGIYTSGAGAQVVGNRNADFDRLLADARSGAVGQTVNLKASETAGANTYAQQEAERRTGVSQFNAGELNRLNELVFGRGTDVNVQNAGERNRLNELAFGRGTDVNLANAGGTNAASLQNAAEANTTSRLGYTTGADLAAQNAQEANLQNRFNAEQAASRESENAARQTQVSEANAARRTGVTVGNADRTTAANQANAQTRNAYNVDAFQYNPATSWQRYQDRLNAFYGGNQSTSSSSQRTHGAITSLFQ